MFNPHQSILELKIFKVLLSVQLVIALVSAILIISNSPLYFSFNYEGFNYFFNVFKFPLAVLASIIPVVALIAANHRSEQTKEQIRVTNSQNNFTNYYKHLEEFEKFAEIASEKYSFHYAFNFRYLHSKLFSGAKEGHYSPNESVIDDFTNFNIEMLALLSRPLEKNQSKIEVIEIFVNKQKSFHNKQQVSLPKWSGMSSIENKRLPNSLFELLASTTKLTEELNLLIQFDTAYVESSRVKGLEKLLFDEYDGFATYDLSSVDFNPIYEKVTAIS
ncbi:hypothetical protein AB6D84_05120 [Vibrio lentus]